MPTAPSRGTVWAFILAALATTATAAPLTVTNDTDADPGSLRATVAAAADGDTIGFDASLNGQTINLTSGVIPINTSISIVGLGSANLTVDAGLNSRIFTVAAGETVSISGLKLAHGAIIGVDFTCFAGDGCDGQGGAIFNQGSLTVTACLFTSNNATGGNGDDDPGAIAGDGGRGAGAAIFNDDGAVLSVSGCQFTFNTAKGGNGGDADDAVETDGIAGDGGEGDGGAIFNSSDGTLEVTGSVFDSNTGLGGDGGIGDDGTNPPGIDGDGGRGRGGAILSEGSLTLGLSSFSTNHATGGVGGPGFGGGGGGADGGALMLTTFAAVSVTTSTFDQNVSASGPAGFGGDGGAIALEGDLVTIQDSTLSGNEATGGEGGGLIHSFGSVELTNVTFNGNSAEEGGAIASFAAFSLLNCTLAGNDATGDGGGLVSANLGGSDTITNTIIAANTSPTAPDGMIFNGAILSGGHNVIGIAFDQSGGVYVAGPGDQIGSSGTPLLPELDPLANNGGPTETMALQLDSPALDQGDDGQCPPFDQTTITSRPQGAHCDVGAYELPTTPGPGGNAFTLTVIRIGGGHVTSAPTAGIDCGNDCSQAYFAGTSLDLTASGAFAGWSGDCSGTNPVVMVVMDADKTCTANFASVLEIPTLGAGALAALAALLGAAGWIALRRF